MANHTEAYNVVEHSNGTIRSTVEQNLQQLLGSDTDA